MLVLLIGLLDAIDHAPKSVGNRVMCLHDTGLLWPGPLMPEHNGSAYLDAAGPISLEADKWPILSHLQHDFFG